VVFERDPLRDLGGPSNAPLGEPHRPAARVLRARATRQGGFDPPSSLPFPLYATEPAADPSNAKRPVVSHHDRRHASQPQVQPHPDTSGPPWIEVRIHRFQRGPDPHTGGPLLAAHPTFRAAPTIDVEQLNQVEAKLKAERRVTDQGLPYRLR
jgi:hypothetical protein